MRRRKPDPTVGVLLDAIELYVDADTLEKIILHADREFKRTPDYWRQQYQKSQRELARKEESYAWAMEQFMTGAEEIHELKGELAVRRLESELANVSN